MVAEKETSRELATLSATAAASAPTLAALTVVIGLGTAVQAAVNTRAGSHFGLSLIGALATFIVGLVLLTALAAAESRAKSLPFLRWSSPPQLLHLVPGLFGVCFVAGGVIVSGAVGASLFWIPLIVGQLSASAALDHFGLSTSGGERKPLDVFKACALAVAVVGAILSVAERLRAPGDLSVGVVIAYELAALVVGALTPAQAALSRAAAARLPSRLAATWWSFAVGLVAIAAVVGAQAAAQPADTGAFAERFESSSWWMFTGGLFGVCYIASSIYWAPAIGSAAYFVALVTGQLAGSAAIDATGALGTAVTPLGPERGIGIALVVVAAVLLAAGRAAVCACCSRVRRGSGGVGSSTPAAEDEATTQGAAVRVGLLPRGGAAPQ